MRQSFGDKALAAGATSSSSNEDVKMHYNGDCAIVCGATTFGEAVELRGARYADTACGRTGAPDSAAGDAAAAWAWHAHHRAGQGGSPRHLREP